MQLPEPRGAVSAALRSTLTSGTALPEGTGVPEEAVSHAERLAAESADPLHDEDLHHRDLYLCHFFANPGDPRDLRLIDAGRVKRLPGWPLRQRWIVKDLAEFWYSTLGLAVTVTSSGSSLLCWSASGRSTSA